MGFRNIETFNKALLCEECLVCYSVSRVAGQSCPPVVLFLKRKNSKHPVRITCVGGMEGICLGKGNDYNVFEVEYWQ